MSPAFARRRCFDDPVLVGAQRGGEESAQLGLVLDEQHERSRSRHAAFRPQPGRSGGMGTTGGPTSGSENWKAAPPPFLDVARIRPPCAATMPRQIVSPSPAPVE